MKKLGGKRGALKLERGGRNIDPALASAQGGFSPFSMPKAFPQLHPATKAKSRPAQPSDAKPSGYANRLGNQKCNRVSYLKRGPQKSHATDEHARLMYAPGQVGLWISFFFFFFNFFFFFLFL